MAQAVTYEVEDGIAVLSIDNPPVNALAAQVRIGLAAGLEQALADRDVHAIVIRGEGRTFSAGADISEFGKPTVEPSLPELCNMIEASPKPTVAALHGTALGGGFEVALSAHYRVADRGAKFGLPEVTLGILPGAGGTQRAPRLGGVDLALELMLSGKPMAASAPQAAVFFDAIIDDDLRQAAVRFARDLVDNGAPVRPTRDANAGFIDAVSYQRAIAARRGEVSQSPEMAPREILRCVEAAELLPFEQGLVFERAAFEQCLISDQSKALRHVFFGERRAAKFQELDDATLAAPRDMRKIGVVGSGRLASAVATACLAADLNVVVVEQGDLGHEGANDFATLSDVDMVVDATADDLQTKLSVFAKLSDVVKEGTILATTTSLIDVNKIAESTNVPGDVLGLHFILPAESNRMVEVVVGTKTLADVVATGVVFVKNLNKIPVRVQACDGFIATQMLTAYRTAADFMLEEGATPYIIDEAMQAYGMVVGPYEMLDAEGLEISWARRKRLAASRDQNDRYVAIGDILCEANRLGRQAKEGYYSYRDGSLKPQHDPKVIALIRAERERKGITPRGFRAAEIQLRCVAAMANEGARLLRRGVAARPSDIDVVMIHCCGFPRWRGGPMMAADLMGLLDMRRYLEDFARENAGFWTPDPVFRQLVKNGQNFSDLNG